jgi:transposase
MKKPPEGGLVYRHDWMNVHIACGVKTNIVTVVRVFEDKDSPDAPQFTPLVQETYRNFKIEEVSADKAYSSVENFETVAECGGTGYIAFRSNATGKAGGKFEKMLHLFRYKQAEFLEHYHRRSNVESTFSMVKRKFGDAVRSKTDTAMINEVLCKFLCHNLCVLIHEQAELGIGPKSPADGSFKLTIVG